MNKLKEAHETAANGALDLTPGHRLASASASALYTQMHLESLF